MKADLQAIRELIGAPRAKGQATYVVPKLAGFSKAQRDLICQMSERGIREVMSFCFVGRNLTEKGMQIAMRRFTAVAWMLHSELLVGEHENGEIAPLSLNQLGKVPQLNCTKVALSLLAKRFGGQFNFQSRMQKRQGTKGNYAASAKTGWDKRRKRIQATKRAAAAKRRARKRAKK